jgi:hypothetical protein
MSRTEKMMSDTTFDIRGLDELAGDIAKATKLWPDEMRRSLDEQGKRFAKFARKEYKGLVKKHTGNITKGFSASHPIGVASDMQVNFRAEAGKRNPHFHLIENGHELYRPWYKSRKLKIKYSDGGERLGFVPGKHAMPKIADEYAPEFYKATEETVEKILRECDLT